MSTRHVAGSETLPPVILLPKGHKLGMRVPIGGSMCANCAALLAGNRCASPVFRQWRKAGGAVNPSLIPAPTDRYCCDVYQIRPAK